MKQRSNWGYWLLAWAILVAFMGSSLACNPEEGPEPSTTLLGELIAQGVLDPPAAVINHCGEKNLCIWVTPGSGENHSAAYEDGSGLGVFDGIQGRVATWVTVVIVGGPEKPDPPARLTVEVLEGGKPINVVNTLAVPLKPRNGYRVRDGYMVEMLSLCCAKDYVGKQVQVRASLYIDGNTQDEYVFDAVLTEVGFPQ